VSLDDFFEWRETIAKIIKQNREILHIHMMKIAISLECDSSSPVPGILEEISRSFSVTSALSSFSSLTPMGIS